MSVPAADAVQLVTIGHAIVDVLAYADDRFLADRSSPLIWAERTLFRGASTSNVFGP